MTASEISRGKMKSILVDILVSLPMSVSVPSSKVIQLVWRGFRNA